MKSVGSRDIIKLLRRDGWWEAAVRGSHHQFRHPRKPGRVTVPHPKKDLSWGLVKSILRQAGLDETDL
ncbi:MAG TPA: type II toxin-antitoxin system HicA family toxin [Alphaproteobacteria bacterium]|nr:type II toxin-antitoxin system HicA family toxin [Alphaproteobacteria bacterium]